MIQGQAPNPLYAEVSPEDRRVISRTLRGSALYGLITQCAMDGDIAFLQAIKEADHFGQRVQGLLRPLDSIIDPLSSGASAEFNALAEILNRSGRINVTWSTLQKNTSASQAVPVMHLPGALLQISGSDIAKGITSWATSGVPYGSLFEFTAAIHSLSVSGPMRDFLRTLAREVVEKFQQEEAIASSKSQSGLFRVRCQATLDLWGSMACALNDLEMLETVMSSPYFMGLSATGQVSPGIFMYDDEQSPFRLPSFKMAAWAVIFNSTEVMERLLQSDPGVLETGLGQYVPSGEDGGSKFFKYEALTLSSLYKFADDLIPTPEFMRCILRSMKDASGHYRALPKVQDDTRPPGNDHQILKMLMEKTARQLWPHLTAMCLEEGVYESNPAESKRLAASWAVLPLMKHFSAQLDLQSTVHTLDGRWFSEHHAVHSLLEISPLGDGLMGSRDDCLLLALQELDRRGLLADQMTYCHADGLTLAGMMVKKKLVQSLAFVLSRGVALGPGSGHAIKGKTLEELASAVPGSNLAAMIHSAHAKRYADAALAEINAPSL